MSWCSRFTVQPLPYSKSLLYPLLQRNSGFLQWYHKHSIFDNVYFYNKRTPLLTYNYSYQYKTQPSLYNLHIHPGSDIIMCNMTLYYAEQIYHETIQQNVVYTPHNITDVSNSCVADYIINTNCKLEIDGIPSSYDNISDELLTILHS